MQQQQNASKFHRSKTMPKFITASTALSSSSSQSQQFGRNMSTLQQKQKLSTFHPPQFSTHSPSVEMKHHQQQKFDAHPQFPSLPQQQINQPRKIPPKPPQRQFNVRHEPEGMQQSHQMPVTAEFHEKKTFQLALVQQTHKLAREPLKPPINFNQLQFLQQQQQLPPPPYLLNQIQSPSSSLMSSPNAVHFAPNFQNFPNNNFHNVNRNLHHQMFPTSPQKQQQLIHNSNNNSNMMRMTVMKNHHNQTHNGSSSSTKMRMMMMLENNAEKSDPENHIYEMIDEYEVSGQKFHQPAAALPQQKSINTNDENNGNQTEMDEGGDLFQNLLRAEMKNQMQLCNSNSSGNFRTGNNNGYLSHLTQEKRMDVIQETALALATAAYLEK